jgi:hypothetical protein
MIHTRCPLSSSGGDLVSAKSFASFGKIISGCGQLNLGEWGVSAYERWLMFAGLVWLASSWLTPLRCLRRYLRERWIKRSR